MNNEILVLLELALRVHGDASPSQRERSISVDAQIEMWQRLSGEWDDDRSTNEIIDEIYAGRTAGRTIDL